MKVRNNGRVKFELYPNGTPYRDEEEAEAMQRGALPQIMGFSGLYQALGFQNLVNLAKGLICTFVLIVIKAFYPPN